MLLVALVLLGVALENVGIGLLIPLSDALNSNTSPSVRVAGNVVRLGLSSGVTILASAIICRSGVQLLTPGSRNDWSPMTTRENSK
jgi:hypothetical protein